MIKPFEKWAGGKGSLIKQLTQFYPTELKRGKLNKYVEYEIIAAFYSRVYYTNETNVFRYYYFIDANNETEFNDFVNNAKKDSIYNTGISANYGDQLLTLSTCSYHTEDGRFAVVARKKTNEN